MNKLQIFDVSYKYFLTERYYNAQITSKDKFNFRISKVGIFYNFVLFFQKFKIFNKCFDTLRSLINTSALSQIYITKFYLKGVGYKFLKIRSQPCILKVQLGYSSFLYFRIPQFIKIFHKRDKLILLSFRKNELFRFSKFIFNLRPADVYKGKGVRLSTIPYTSFKTGKQR